MKLLKTLFFVLGRLTATSFLSQAEAEAALGEARAHFDIDLKNAAESLRFDVGGSCPSDPSQLVVIRRAPDVQRACAPRDLQATLELEPQAFVDQRAFSLHSDEVEELDIAGGTQKFALVRKGSGFVLHASSETQVELEAGNQRITELLEAEGQIVPSESGKLHELGLDPALSLVTLRSSAARDADVTTQVVRVGKRDEAGNLFVYREQDAVVLRIPRDLARGFAIDSTLLYSRKLTEFGLSSFIFAEIEQKGAKQVLRRVNDGLSLDEPKGFAADGVLSSDLIQALGALTAERFVADRDDGSFGLQHASLRVRFAFKNGEGKQVEHHLRFGDETALGVFASLQDDGPVFVLARSVRDTCQLSLINRAVFPASTDAWNAITLEAHGRTLQLVRQGEHFTVAKAGSFPQERVQELLDALGDLRPEAALHSGAGVAQRGIFRAFIAITSIAQAGHAADGQLWRGRLLALDECLLRARERRRRNVRDGAEQGPPAARRALTIRHRPGLVDQLRFGRRPVPDRVPVTTVFVGRYLRGSRALHDGRRRRLLTVVRLFSGLEMRLDVTQRGKARARPQRHDFTGDRRALAQWANGTELEAVTARTQNVEPLTVRRHPVDQCHVLRRLALEPEAPRSGLRPASWASPNRIYLRLRSLATNYGNCRGIADCLHADGRAVHPADAALDVVFDAIPVAATSRDRNARAL